MSTASENFLCAIIPFPCLIYSSALSLASRRFLYVHKMASDLLSALSFCVAFHVESAPIEDDHWFDPCLNHDLKLHVAVADQSKHR